MTVHLVGAGPGDPGLITLRGLELVRSCDVLVFDRLVAQELVDEAPAHALRIGRNGLGQDAVNELLVCYGRSSRVVRLKGGDPFVFGRGGEEVAALTTAGVPYEVVPGVSAISAVPAAAGIPVTHRGVATQVTVATGSSADGGTADHAALARAPGTLVFFMALDPLEAVVEGLLANGKDPSTPAAIVSRGTLPGQRTVISTLEQIVAARREDAIESPALLIVGEVVAVIGELGDRTHSDKGEAGTGALELARA